MDNTAFHKSDKTKELIESAKCKLLFLHPYSPDLELIKKFWAHLKAKIRASIQDFSSPSDSIFHALCPLLNSFNYILSKK